MVDGGSKVGQKLETNYEKGGIGLGYTFFALFF
jgi:hypothetical protein